jgi:dUTP pyrophosphatase
MQIKTEMTHWDTTSEKTHSAFTVVPRSSMSKSELMLANHVGIIDSGYRGSLMGAFRWLPHNIESSSEYSVTKHTRLLQICHPSLCPIIVELIENEDELSSTERGDGAFGSTGL